MQKIQSLDSFSFSPLVMFLSLYFFSYLSGVDLTSSVYPPLLSSFLFFLSFLLKVEKTGASESQHSHSCGDLWPPADLVHLFKFLEGCHG